MSKKEDTAFQEWKREIEAKLSDEQRSAFAILAGNEEAAKEVFRGALREADYYRRLNEHNAQTSQFEAERRQYESEKAKLASWFETEAPKNQKLLEEKRALVARVTAAQTTLRELGLTEEAEALASGSMGVGTSHSRSEDAPPASDRELSELRTRVQNIDRALPQLLGQYGTVIAEAARGKWDVDPEQIMQFSIQNNVDPKTAFWQLTAEEREERAKDELETKLKKAREEGRREALTNSASPDGMTFSGPSPVETLRKGVTSDHRSRVDAAVAAFAEMGSQS